MPEMDGVETTRRLLAEQPGLPILMLTLFDDDERVRQALAAGAGGYLLKSTTDETLLINSIRLGQAGGVSLDSSLVGRLVAEGVRPKPTAAPPGEPLSDLGENYCGMWPAVPRIRI